MSDGVRATESSDETLSRTDARVGSQRPDPRAVGHATQLFRLIDPVAQTDHTLGPQQAPVTLVEYGDFECPSCKQAAPAVELLLQRFPQRIRFVFRPFPLEDVHPHALGAAEAAECAGAQGRFWEMHDLLFANQSHLMHQQLLSYADRLELDPARFKAELDDEVYRQRIREHQRAGELSGVRGTPTFFINGRILDVSYGLRSLVDAIDSELRR